MRICLCCSMFAKFRLSLPDGEMGKRGSGEDEQNGLHALATRAVDRAFPEFGRCVRPGCCGGWSECWFFVACPDSASGRTVARGHLGTGDANCMRFRTMRA